MILVDFVTVRRYILAQMNGYAGTNMKLFMKEISLLHSEYWIGMALLPVIY